MLDIAFRMINKFEGPTYVSQLSLSYFFFFEIGSTINISE